MKNNILCCGRITVYKKSFFSNSAILLIVISMYGCASTLKIKSIEPNIKVVNNIPITHKEINIAVNKFDVKDDKIKKNIIGQAKTGLFNFKSDIILEEPIVDLFQKAIKNGFEKSGYKIVEPNFADYIIDGIIEKCWVDEYATGLSLEYSKGYIRYDLIVKNSTGKTVWGNTIEEYQTSGKAMDTTSNDIPTLKITLENSVKSIFTDKNFIDTIK
jgi:hypothetical protein